MWNKPWRYQEGFTICAGLFATGTLLNATIGKVNFDLLVFPVNLLLLVFYLAVLAVMHFSADKVYLFGWMRSYNAAVPAMASVAAMTVFMGLIPQLQPEAVITGIRGWLGFSQMLSAWSFTMILGWFVTILGLVILKRASRFKWRDIPFILNHLGLFIALVAAVLGSADMRRLNMTVREGQTEWRAATYSGMMEELPLAIELHDFTIDEYPPKLMLIDNETGKVLPVENSVNLLIEDDFESGELLGWNISILRRIPEAASMAAKDTIMFVDFHSTGAAYALLVEATSVSTGAKKVGWVSCGSFMFPYKALKLDNDVSLIMPDREPRRYASEVTVFTESGKQEDAVIEVNQPFETEGWKIYQVSYDENKGRWSDVSVFELVRDPWLPVVYAGIWMMIAGAICMFAIPQNRMKNELE